MRFYFYFKIIEKQIRYFITNKCINCQLRKKYINCRIHRNKIDEFYNLC